MDLQQFCILLSISISTIKWIKFLDGSNRSSAISDSSWPFWFPQLYKLIVSKQNKWIFRIFLFFLTISISFIEFNQVSLLIKWIFSNFGFFLAIWISSIDPPPPPMYSGWIEELRGEWVGMKLRAWAPTGRKHFDVG